MASVIPQAEHDRTVSHMNKDHASDLSLYLRHYNKLPAKEAADAQLESLTLDRMTIRSASGTHTVLLRPPMRAWADRRTRLIDMAVDSRAAITAPDPDMAGEFRNPALAPDLVAAGGVLLYYTCFAVSQAGLIYPGSAVWDFLLAIRFPGGPRFFRSLVDSIAALVLLIHVVEVFVFHFTRLRRYGVATGSRAWSLWSFWTMWEGVFAIRRFDRLVFEKKREAVEKEAKSH